MRSLLIALLFLSGCGGALQPLPNYDQGGPSAPPPIYTQVVCSDIIVTTLAPQAYKLGSDYLLTPIADGTYGPDAYGCTYKIVNQGVTK